MLVSFYWVLYVQWQRVTRLYPFDISWLSCSHYHGFHVHHFHVHVRVHLHYVHVHSCLFNSKIHFNSCHYTRLHACIPLTSFHAGTSLHSLQIVGSTLACCKLVQLEWTPRLYPFDISVCSGHDLMVFIFIILIVHRCHFHGLTFSVFVLIVFQTRNGHVHTFSFHSFYS